MDLATGSPGAVVGKQHSEGVVVAEESSRPRVACSRKATVAASLAGEVSGAAKKVAGSDNQILPRT